MHDRSPFQKASFSKLRLFNQKPIYPELKFIQEPNAKSSTAIAAYICYKLFMHNKNAGPLLTLPSAFFYLQRIAIFFQHPIGLQS